MSSYRIAFTLSLATLLTSAVHHPETLRGLSRWTLDFILRGPNALRLQKKKVDAGMAATNGGTPPNLLNRRK